MNVRLTELKKYCQFQKYRTVEICRILWRPSGPTSPLK